MNTENIFREAAINARQTKWLGDIVLIRPLSFALLTAIPVLISACIIVFGIIGSYTKHATVQGQIVRDICFFDPHANQAWIEQCADMAAIANDIAAMPMGYNTLVGDMGTVLSGGQKQRILLARALYKRPKILFLDEATSHLDISKEHEVNAAVRALRVTRVIVAHRPETIASANRVMVLANGKIIQDMKVPQQVREKLHEAAIA